MSRGIQGEITFEGLKRYLCDIGFQQPAKFNGALAFHHLQTGTIIVLSIPEDGTSVRSADLVSVLMRLETQGLVDDSTLALFRSGRIPMAS